MTDRDLVVTAVTGGSTYPAGTTSYTGATNVIVYAIPARGYILSGWTFNTVALSSKASRLTVALNAGTNTLLPSFTLAYTTSNNPSYNRIKTFIIQQLNLSNLSVTLQTLSLGAQDSDTGIPARSYTESTIEMLIISKESKQVTTQLGVSNVLDCLGITQTATRVFDKVKTSTGKNYIIQSVKPNLDGSGQLNYYELSLKEEVFS